MIPLSPMSNSRTIVVTSALPYANGEIHIGHLVEYLQTDFWTRFQRMRGHDCIYVCADDTHGTPVMLRARQEDITPEALIARSHERHLADFSDFEIAFDHYGSTHSEANREFSNTLYKAMEDNGHIDVRAIEQTYCEHDSMFLPDRFVKGTCPRCKTPDQHGDSCDSCGATYSPAEVLDPHCSICGNTPAKKSTDHVFFKLNDFKDFLREWLPKHTASEVSNKLLEWFDEDLRDWDISRDAPYFGFEIPGHPDKYFYVWVDAPIGYLSATYEWCEKNDRKFDEFWRNAEAERYHFIGKDIVRFHCLFWPAMLKNGGLQTPNEVFVHGFLTVNGEKMSKAKGTFVNARTYLKHLDPMYLRFYYACKLGPGAGDIDLSFPDFLGRVNSDLIGKITNLASRGAVMLHKIDGRMGQLDDAGKALVTKAMEASETLAALYESREFSKVMVQIRDLADEVNVYFDTQAPWQTIKEDPETARQVMSSTLNAFRILAVYLKPILPHYVAKVEALFNEAPYTWESAQELLTEHNVNTYEHLATRVQQPQIDAIINDTQDEIKADEKVRKAGSKKTSKETPMIEFDDFMKVELTVAEILEASDIEGADKLLQLTVSLGNDDTRNIIAGIKKAYDPADLPGRKVIVVSNLAPRKMKFGVSEGMVVCAGEGDADLYLCAPDDGAKVGQRIK